MNTKIASASVTLNFNHAPVILSINNIVPRPNGILVDYQGVVSMTAASSRAVLLSVVKRGNVFLHRFVRLAGTFLKTLSFAVLRAVITGIVFTTCVMFTLHYLGVPVPGPAELLDKFEGLGKLVDVLS